MRPEGALVALATPFTPDSTILRSTLRQMVDFVIERGVDGIFAASTVGEFIHLGSRQRHELVALVVEYAEGRVPVFAGATDTTPRRVLGHCREFRLSGASAAVIGPPYYFPMRQEDIFAHYSAIADSIDMPFALYHIPQCSSRMTVETMLRVVESCGPVALKNSSPDVMEMMALLRRLKDGTVAYLVGPDELLLTGLELGAAGAMSGLTGVMPEAVRLLMGAFRAGNHDLARRMQYMFLELLELAEEIPFPEGLKVLLEIRGFEMGPPLRARSAATHRAIEQRRPELARKIESILEFVRQEATA